MAYLNYTKEQLNSLFDFYGNKCLVCGSSNVTIDHVKPTSIGGFDTLDNIQPLCLSCNARKNYREIDYRPCPCPGLPVIENPIRGNIGFAFRLPEDLYAMLEQDAKQNGRSINSQLIQILKERYETTVNPAT